LQDMGVNLGQEALGGILADIDHDGTGDIDLLEFIELMVRCGGVKDELELAREAFNQYDADGSGMIDRDEYIRCIKQLDPSLTTKDIDKMMLLADANNDGRSREQCAQEPVQLRCIRRRASFSLENF
jgi:Ca2+-binding EF-hand superfamily protein